MALTISTVRRTVMGNLRLVIADVTFDSSYPTGGESLAASDVQLTTLERVSAGVAVKSDGTLAILTAYDHTNKKLQAFKSNTAANPQEVADTGDLSTYKARLEFIGL